MVLSGCICAPLPAQVIHHADFRSWTEYSGDPKSHFYYPHLLERFLSDDSTLTDDELALLSHGYSCTPDYHPYGQSLTEDSLYTFNRSKDFASTLRAGERYLRTNPVSLRAHFAMVVALRNLGRPDEFHRYQSRMFQLLRAVTSTGSGGSTDSAMAVINASDEYLILGYLGFTSGSQSLLTGPGGRSYDKLDAVSRNDPQTKKEFYFDITRPMNSLAREYEK